MKNKLTKKLKDNYICDSLKHKFLKCLEINYNSNIDNDNCIEIYNNYLKCKKRLEFIIPKLKY